MSSWLPNPHPARWVRTVTGDISSEDLGICYCHEHLATRPLVDLGADLVLDDERRTEEELALFVRAGGSSMVDASTADHGRDLSALLRLSRRTGVNVVAVTGHSSEDFWRGALPLEDRSVAEFVDEMVLDLTEPEREARAGLIKVGTSLNELTATERRILAAAAEAHRATGAPITTHTTAGTMGLEQARRLLDAGVDPESVCIGHLDRNLLWEEHLELAQMGVHLGYDCISKDWYEPDATRVSFILRLFDEGFGDRLCLSGDLARRSSLVAWGGGPGYVHILWRFIPWLRRQGLDEAGIRMLLIENPSRFLSWTLVNDAYGPT